MKQQNPLSDMAAFTTTINGGTYMIPRNFHHPGGAHLLKHAHQRDVTALFEMHHPWLTASRRCGLLGQFEVPLPSLAPDAIFQWDSAFQTDLKLRIQAYFTHTYPHLTTRQASKATWTKWCECLLLHVLLMIVLWRAVQGDIWTLIGLPSIAWVAGSNVFHDASHGAWSHRPLLNILAQYLPATLFFTSPWYWYHEHILGHHAYTNIERLDPDLAHDPAIFRGHVSVRWRHAHRLQRELTVWLRTIIGVPLGLQLHSTWKFMRGIAKYNQAVLFTPMSGSRYGMHVMGRVLYLLVIYISPFLRFEAWYALLFATVPSLVFSIWFMLVSQISHLNDKVAHGVEADGRPCWYTHQVRTSLDVATESWIAGLLSGRLNMQVVHHLFPTINSCHFRALMPIVRETCLAHGIAYQEVPSYWAGFQSHLRQVEQLSLFRATKLD
jgi:fatty acid desaturase